MQVKEPNNFINLILNSVYKARGFKQQFRFTITSKVVCECITLRFYIRKRYNEVYLYTRIYKDNFGNNQHIKDFLESICLLCNDISIVSTQGHYKGLLINTSNSESLYNYLKLIAVLANPHTFITTKNKYFISLKNKVESSRIPVHTKINTKVIESLSEDVKKTLYNIINNTNNINNTSIESTSNESN